MNKNQEAKEKQIVSKVDIFDSLLTISSFTKEGEDIYCYALQFSRMYDGVVKSQKRVPASTENAAVINAHKMGRTIIAELVNLAFANELYLKAILKYEKTNYRHEHRLDKLYNLLSNETKREIKNIMVKLCKENFGEDLDFDDFLVKNANVFLP